jgi:AcrR family transcriptional regulator
MLKLMRVISPTVNKAGPAPPADRRMLAAIRQKRRQLIDLGARVLEEGIASGEFRRMDTRQAAAFIEAVLQGYAHLRFWDSETPLSPGSAEGLTRFMLEGIRDPEHVRKEI